MSTVGTLQVQLRVVSNVDGVRARVQRYREYLERQRIEPLRQVQTFAVALGVRPLIQHMSVAEILRRAANEDAYSAVLCALEGVD